MSTLAVCITYYNEGPLLTKCLHSLYANTHLPDEVLVYDDASADPAAQYLADFPQVRLIRKDINRGPGYGRDQLIFASRCDYVHLHDADDEFHPEWCDHIYRAMKTQPDIILTNVEINWESEERHTSPYWITILADKPLHKPLIVELVKHGGVFPAVLTFNRELAITAGGHRWREVIPYGEDHDFAERLISHTENYVYIHEQLVIKWQRAVSYSQAYDKNQIAMLYRPSLLKAYTLNVQLMPQEAAENLLPMISVLLLERRYIADPLYYKVRNYLISLHQRRESPFVRGFHYFNRSPLNIIDRLTGYRGALAMWRMYYRVLGLLSRWRVSTH